MKGADFTFYFGAASGQQRSALRRLDPEGVMISYATECNIPWDGDYSLFIDCGGFHHMAAGTGEYDNGEEFYLKYVNEHRPDLWALRDYPCEPALLEAHGRTVEEHQRRTTEAHVGCLTLASQWGTPGTPVSVLQGWTVNQYLDHLDDLRAHACLTDYVGIGSVCRRGQDAEIAEIILTIREELPDDTKLHAFGVKGSVLRFREVVEALDSADSAAYDWQESRFPSKRSTDSFTWRDAARSYLNWRYQLQQTIGTESLFGDRTQQTVLPGIAAADGGLVGEDRRGGPE